MSTDNLLLIVYSTFAIFYFPILLWQFSWSKPWDYAKNQDFFGLKWKFAIWLIPIPFAQFAVLVVLFFPE